MTDEKITLNEALAQLQAAKEGTAVALIAITKALRESPGFNVEELERWADYFADNPSQTASTSDGAMSAYRLMVNTLRHRET